MISELWLMLHQNKLIHKSTSWEVLFTIRMSDLRYVGYDLLIGERKWDKKCFHITWDIFILKYAIGSI